MNPPPTLDLDDRRTVEYNNGRCLGQGATSIVWECILKTGDGTDAENEMVAVKCASAHNDQKREELENELRVWKAVHNHKNIVKLFGSVYVRQDEQNIHKFYSVMEKLPFSLENLIFKDEGFAESCTYFDCLKIFEGICKALSHCHAKGVIHHDLKPENVLLTEHWEAKLSDFGTSKRILQARDSVTARCCGTMQYMAPEVVCAHQNYDSSIRVTKAIDVFSLGALMWTCLHKSKISRGNPSNTRGVGRDIKWYGFNGSVHKWCGGPTELCALVESCLQYHGRSARSDHGRPSIDKVLRALQQMMEKPWSKHRVLSYCKPNEAIDRELLKTSNGHQSTQAQETSVQGAQRHQKFRSSWLWISAAILALVVFQRLVRH